ncbi:deoxynucleoside kinase-like [Paramacrobiotus metropolitanus]|nr:deoxynucleoside kinase-like [Paramacrobiotus metropolitanus]XP_055354033.1 deoxynucleoside kinase-like [Paramacrobiotus metropolitanus]
MYKDPRKYGFDFQKLVMQSMMDRQKNLATETITVFERSIFSARYVFTESLRSSELLENVEYEKLDELFQNYSAKHLPVTMIIYLKASVETLQQRILCRGREEESCITKAYLTKLNELYDTWLSGKCFPVPSIIMTMNAEIPQAQLYADIKEQIFRLI